MGYRICILLLWVAVCRPLAAQQADSDSTAGVSAVRLGIVGGVTTGAFIYGHILQSELWWKGEKSAFHFDWEHDWNYALGADKLGHFFFPYFMSDVYQRAFLWSGMDTASGLWLASGLALSYETYVEIRDGFSKEWGFSWGDFAADALGAAFPVARHYIPALKPYSMKISFFPSRKFRDGQYSVIFDDYESTFHWLSVDMHLLLQQNGWDGWPPWLNLAVGHGVGQLDFAGGGTHQLYLSLDWNLHGVPVAGWWWDTIAWVFGYYRLPAPAVRIYPDVVWYGLRF